MDWEQKTAIKRSEGTFFKNLYRIKKELPGAQASAAINTEVHTNPCMSPTSFCCCLHRTVCPVLYVQAMFVSAWCIHPVALVCVGVFET